MDRHTAERIFRAYRTGLLLKDEESARRRRPSFQTLFLQILWARFPLTERLVFRHVWKLGLRGLQAAREGRLEESARLFEESRERMEGGGLSPESRLLSISFLESAHAYLEYRLGDSDQALERTLLAMDADVVLEESDAYSLLQLHRIQGANNLMRLDVRAGAYERALDLAGRILAFLEDRLDGLPVHRSWDSASLRRTPRSIRRAMTAQVANEAVMALAQAPGDDALRTFLDLVDPGAEAHESSIIHARFRKWVCLKRAFEDRDWPEYLARVEEFLSQGREDIGALWLSSVIDFLEFCRLEGSQLSTYVRQGILRDSAKWPLVPSMFRDWLDQEMAGEEPPARAPVSDSYPPPAPGGDSAARHRGERDPASPPTPVAAAALGGIYR